MRAVPMPKPSRNCCGHFWEEAVQGCHHQAQGRSGSKGAMRAGLAIKEEKAEIIILEADQLP